MKRILLLCAYLFAMLETAQGQVYVYPTDTLVDPSMFDTNNLLTSWTYSFCAVGVNGSGDTIKAPCYIVTYKDHYNTSIDLCPATKNDVGGLGLFNGTPRLLDLSLFNDMETYGSNIISNTDNSTINYKNLTTGQQTNGGGTSPKYCIEADLYLGNTGVTWYQKFQILLGPVVKTGGTVPYHTAEPIGVLKNGLVLEHTPPSSESTQALNGGIIPIDRCGWHPEPAGFGHFHAIPTGINVALTANGINSAYHCTDIAQENGSGFVGITFEGVPMYGPYDDGSSTAPADLDACNGHVGATPEYPSGVYHYHASATNIINNPPCRKYYAPLESFRFTYGEWVTTGVKMKEEKSLVSIFPNPTTNNLTIKGDYDQLIVQNSMGQVIVAQSAGKDVVLNVEHWDSGIYFISAQKGDVISFEKFVVE